MGSSFCFAVKLFTMWFLLSCSWIWLSLSRYFPVQNHRKDIPFPSMAFLSRNFFFKRLKDLGKKIPQDPEEVQTSERAEDETPHRPKAPLPGWAAARVLQQSPTCPGFQALLDAFFFSLEIYHTLKSSCCKLCGAGYRGGHWWMPLKTHCAHAAAWKRLLNTLHRKQLTSLSFCTHNHSNDACK